MNSTITLTTSLVLIALFTVAILSFSVGFANDNNAGVNVATDPELSSLSTTTKAGAASFKTDAEDTYSSIAGTTLEPGKDVISSSGSFTITAGNVMGVTKNIVTVGYQKVFGKGGGFGIFLTTFIAMLVFMAGLFIIKTWRGNP